MSITDFWYRLVVSAMVMMVLISRFTRKGCGENLKCRGANYIDKITTEAT